MAVKEVSPQAFHEQWKKSPEKVVLVDVRTPLEFRERRAIMATSLQLSEVSAARVRQAAAGREVFLVCKSGARAKQAAEKLVGEGMGEVVLVTGGTDAWVAAGLPVAKDAGVISLERQVRIGAGLIVAIFSVLALTLNPYFVLGALFVGCGLVFAGITNWCGMGLLLAKMPWNKGAGSCSA
jgi:rhodanese-related sulfurtransferase